MFAETITINLKWVQKVIHHLYPWLFTESPFTTKFYRLDGKG